MAADASPAYDRRIELLRSRLPGTESLVDVDHPSVQARAVLGALIEICLSLEPDLDHPLKADFSKCPACNSPTESEKSLYCSAECREESAIIRQIRHGLVDGSLDNEEKQAALGAVLWHSLGGGYPARQKLLDEKRVRKLFERNDGMCEVCGQPATTFDHVGSACNRSINLKVVCDNCTETSQFEDPEFLSRHANQVRLTAIASRIRSEQPLRVCDDPTNWIWSEYMAHRRSQTRNGS